MVVGRRATAVLALALALATAALYAPALDSGFVFMDDDDYILENPWIQGGLTRAGMAKALRPYEGNWDPLTWVSHMIDIQIFGLEPLGHHLTSLSLHALNAALLFLVLAAATGRRWPSLAVAGVFALHPLRVESVAWVSERKDVLAGLFWMLALGAHLRYARRPTPGRYAAVALLMVCGLLSKPTVMMLPIALLILDFWPLGRLRPAGSAAGGQAAWRGPVAEKIPLLLLSAASAAATYYAQATGGATGALIHVEAPMRAALAATSYLWYLGKNFWPANLSVIYLHPERYPPLPQLLLAISVLVALSALVIALRRPRPYLAAGWAWYLAILLPMIGLVAIGRHLTADRFGYLPLVGVSLMLVWTVADLVRARPARTVAAAVAAILVGAALVGATRVQLAVWRDSATLFRHALAIDPANDRAHLALGVTMHRGGDLAAALRSYQDVIRVRPREAEAYLGIGMVYSQLGLPGQEEAAYLQGLSIVPDSPRLLYNLWLVYRSQGRTEEAARVGSRLRTLPAN